MGMFDSFYAQNGDEWQTKAFGCSLEFWRVGEPFETEGPQTFQVEAIGDERGSGGERFTWAFVTVRDGVVEAAGVPEDRSLLRYEYSSGFALPGEPMRPEPMIWHDEADRLATWGSLDPLDACMCRDCVLVIPSVSGDGAS